MLRIAVVDQLGNPGGGSRFLRSLLLGYRMARPDLSVTLLCNADALQREGVVDELERAGVAVQALDSVRARPVGASILRRSIAKLARAPGRLLSSFDWLPAHWSRTLSRELRIRLRGFDVAHFWWPYGVEPPETPVPLVATFHDFNFKYAFQTPTLNVHSARLYDVAMDAWVLRSSPVVSSRFMYDEFMAFFPAAPVRPEIIRLPLNPPVPRAGDARARLRALGVRSPYVLYPANTCAHKNLGCAVAAQALLAAEGLDHQLVLTGPGTEALVGEARSLGMVRRGRAGNVLGLGYVSNEDMDSLLDGASVVISTSLYEAGNGPGVDAWMRGVPVAMSNIPSFTEHLEVHGVEASIFDPTSPKDIARVIGEILRNPEEAGRRAERSKAALARLDDLLPARRYIDKLIAVAQGEAK